jgi:hypothetical protein
MGLAKFVLQAGLNRRERWLIVNDQDWSGFVSDVTLHVAPNGVPELHVRAIAEGAICGEGIVRVMGTEDPDLGTVVATFIDNIDPQQLEAEALANLGLGDSATTAMLDRLKAIARGE